MPITEKIEFFETEVGLDKKAAQGGIYHIELLDVRTGQAISLYIGESVWCIERCGTHLYKLFNNPNYLGLTEEDLTIYLLGRVSVIGYLKKICFFNESYL